MRYNPHGNKFLGLSESDGTVDFYLRIGCLSGRDKILLDLGAGRAGWFEDDAIELRRSVRQMKGRFSKVVAADLDEAVFQNKASDLNVLIEDGRVPLDDETVDVIVADFVFEHVDDVEAFKAEIMRVLKPGGWLCARTPHKFHYVSLFSQVLQGPLEDYVLRYAQPHRKEEDVFPKKYKLNSLTQIRQVFRGWGHYSYISRTKPAYFFGRKFVYQVFDFFHRLLPIQLSGNLFIFVQKPE